MAQASAEGAQAANGPVGRVLASAVGNALGILLGLGASWELSIVLDGAEHIAPHWFYLPIFWAGLGCASGAGRPSPWACSPPSSPGRCCRPTWTPGHRSRSATGSAGASPSSRSAGSPASLFARLRRLGDAEARAAELRSRAAEQARFRALLESSHDVVTVLDDEGQVVARFGQVTTVFGPAAAGMSGRLDSLVHPEDRLHLGESLERLRRGTGGSETLRLRVQGDAGQWRHVESVMVDLRQEPAVGGLVLSSRDITDREVLRRELQRQAHHDALTGLPNRTLLADRFEAALRDCGEQAGVGLLLLDLDRFKDVNDVLGHASGDELLVQVAARLTGALRAGDTVARLGGDEFAVLLPTVSGTDDALAVAAKLLSALEAPFVVAGLDLRVEASIGAVSSTEHGTDPAVLLQRADVAMYAAKWLGGIVVPFEEAGETATTSGIALLGQLRSALTDGELVLHYQPKVRLADGAPCGVEALVRWQHPEHGLLPPGAFLPAAEQSGLIGRLTSHVLDAALAQAGRWVRQGRPLPVSVNLSARNLAQPDLPAEVERLLAVHGVPPELLELELTESAIMVEPERARRQLDLLAALGVQIALDDFGAGYTSLSQLKDLPITHLKVDRSFIAELAGDSRSAHIVRSIIDLSRHLGLTTVAEGVETADDLVALQGYGCDAAQGYYLCRPVPADALDQWRATLPVGPVVAQHR